MAKAKKGSGIKMENFGAMEKKWQKAWESADAYKSSDSSGGKKCYVCEMFPYPSASFLHVGHMRNYTIGDSVARYKRMRGFNVMYPMGFDAFGLPAENAAIKNKVHPKKYTDVAIKTIKGYMKELGLSYDWSREIATCSPEYYKWNQWLFLRMLEKGIAYRKKAPVNWCPSCKTVLANEEVIDGKCWRCSSEVTIEQLEQWFLKITGYADELLEGLNGLNWPERVKELQRNWIGRREGVRVVFPIKGSEKTLEVFTTRVDTLYGVTFVACAVQHQVVAGLVKGTKYEKDYLKFVKEISASEKLEADKEKHGFFTGRYAIHPLTNEEVPIYAGNFVVADYGTGAVMGVPAHDVRDFAFAKKHKIAVKRVISIDGGNGALKEAYTGAGVLVGSGEFDGLTSENARDLIAQALARKSIGGKNVEYKLRDWLISRQRYWGTPIPIVYCHDCGVVPVPEKDLPVKLPDKVKFTGKGNPLLTNKEFVETKCPCCGGEAKRETDTMATFFDSSWYYLRYCSPHAHDIFDRKAVEHWMPVDYYIGGIEHAVLHLLYARFFTKFLRDIGWVTFSEPFTKLFNQGLVLAKGGEKMSKSKGNVVTTKDACARFGVDATRFFLLFVSSTDKDMEWDDHGMEGVHRFVSRFKGLFDKVGGLSNPIIDHKLNSVLKLVGDSYDSFEFNRALVKFMELIGYLSEQPQVPRHVLETCLLMVAPVMPHLAEELWHKLGRASLIVQERWPHVDESKIDVKLEQAEQAREKTLGDIQIVLRLVKEKTGKDPKKLYLYTIPPEVKQYNAEELSKRLSMDVKVFAVNDPSKHDPEGKSAKARPGKPALYVAT
jgi:leucyl-tRNA synthetase